MVRRLISSGSPLEPVIGFSRAVRSGEYVAVAGTAPIGSDGGTVGVGDAYLKALRCLAIIDRALDDAGARIAHVIRTRVFLTNISDWEAVARAHGEVFGAIGPACTVMEVSRFIDPDWLVEIEVDAIIDNDSSQSTPVNSKP